MSRALAAAAAAALALAGCGDDEEKPRAGGGQETAARTATEAPRDTTPTTETTPERTETGSSGGGTSPEDQEGGAGDEVPARTQALLTGKGGRIEPRRVRVPPFIAVRIELRSADGGKYTIEVRGRKLSVGGGLASASTNLPGLRPGKAYVANGSGGSRIRIEATAEPGP